MITASNQVCWKVGRGDQILFWEDSWVDDGTPLKDQFPELYRISSQRNLIVADTGSFSENGWEWNLSWRRNLFDNEMGIASKFIEHITTIRLNSNLMDTWVWRAETNGIFSTKSAYQVIKAEQPYEVQHLGFHQLWDIKIPPRALSFAWRLLWDRLPTKDNLSRRQIQTNRSMATNRRWKFWWLAATNSIWKLKNDMIFHNQSFDISKLADSTLFLMWTWLKGWERDFNVPFHHWSSTMSLVFI
ncbi:hypothetical protein JHK82_039705 [Glycine max]|nr:hypothetical protein JHK86_039899 [Glycine max]KAG4965504.1 hypothetical protein JHK85_040479 [Glycine max]KAG5110482.1 hypothetical protein JHK82_039705 [Glycine max]KAG5121771.1 hypothetical protein JHK84_040111 [Glycine max]